MKTGYKVALVVVFLAAVLTLAGYYAVKSSGYLSVSDVLQLDHKAKITVKGYLAGIKTDMARGKLYLLLEDPKTGASLLAIVDAKIIEEKYGPIQYIHWDPSNVVVEGIYDPTTRTLTVTNVLEGCHSSYGQAPVQR